MQADRNDRHIAVENRSRHSTQTIITAIAVIILAAGAYLLAPSDESETPEPAPIAELEPQIQAPQPEPAISVVNAPDIPEEPLVEAAPEPEPEPVVAPPPPPTPEEIDAMVRAAINETGLTPTDGLEAAFAAPYLLDRTVSSVDQLARGLVPRRTLNLARPSGKFTVSGSGESRRVDPASYGRYDGIVSSITALPTDKIASLFHRFRDELQDAYAALGYPADKADNTLIGALDTVIRAPVSPEPPAVVTKGALWAYADPALESASDLHKQLLRTGPDNTQRLQAWATELRSALLQPQ